MKSFSYERAKSPAEAAAAAARITGAKFIAGGAADFVGIGLQSPRGGG
jgi:xanthine dehydrogenase YagS FAD-binding subunit